MKVVFCVLMMLISHHLALSQIICDPNVDENCDSTPRNDVDNNTTTTDVAETINSSMSSLADTTDYDLSTEMSPPTTTTMATTTTEKPLNSNTTFNDYFSAFLEENPNAIQITSKNYPLPYPAQYEEVWSVSVTNGTGIEVIVHFMDTDPLTDSLYIRAGNANTTDEHGPTMTGQLMNPQKFLIMDNTELYVVFKSPRKQQAKFIGFVLTYAPFGTEYVPVTTEVTEVTIPTVQLKTYNVSLDVEPALQLNETWTRFKDMLANSANQYTSKNNMSLQAASSKDVILLSVQLCPESWPNYQNCVRILFAIPLAPLNDDQTPVEEQNAHEDNYQLTTDHLEKMWLEFGQNAFVANGTPEYSIPNADYMLLLWSSISAAIVVTFLFILYSIWKMDFFRDYHRMSTKADDKKSILPASQSSFDISMFPSPHQIVPSFFPNNEQPIAGNGMTQNDYETRPITFQQSDFSRSVHHQSENSAASFSPNFMEMNGNQNSAFVSEEMMIDLSPRSKQKMLLKGTNSESMS